MGYQLIPASFLAAASGTRPSQGGYL